MKVDCLTVIPTDTILKEAYISGNLQKICKDTNLSYPNIIKRAKLEKWPITTQQKSPQPLSPILDRLKKANSPLAKGRIYAEAMGDQLSQKILPHLEEQTADDILNNIDQYEKADKIARRSFGLDQDSANGPTLNINVLAAGLEVFTKQQPQPEKIVLDIPPNTWYNDVK